jgi:hypothetical protein
MKESSSHSDALRRALLEAVKKLEAMPKPPKGKYRVKVVFGTRMRDLPGGKCG